jgi:arylsulfatase A-like enzyme
MALLTGAYPPRVGWRGGVVGYGVKAQNGLAPEALTIAEVFKDAGYKTAIAGKWHLGDSDEHLPMNQGFESCYYIRKSNNQTKKLFRDGELIENPFVNRLLSEKFTVEATKFITANKDNPFFLYLAYTAPHFPAESHPDWKGKSANGAFGDVVEELDFRIGEIIKCLKSNKLDEKPLVIFLSDNGTDPGQKKWSEVKPFRGMKWSALEGGSRVPCMMRWPGVIPGGQQSAELTAAIDLLPTITHACGLDLKKISKDSPKIDGVNVWDTVIGKKDVAHARKDLLVWHGWATPQAIRVGSFKLYLDKVKEIRDSSKRPILINLADDPSESTDISAKYPEKVKAMMDLAEKQLAEITKNTLPLGGPEQKRKIPKSPFWIKKKQ